MKNEAMNFKESKDKCVVRLKENRERRNDVIVISNIKEKITYT